MLGREALGLLCSVYPPLWSLKYAGIGKIVFQVTIVGVQKAGPTHLGERKNVLVIGSKGPRKNNFLEMAVVSQ